MASTHYTILEAVQTRIRALSLSGLASASVLIRKVPLARDIGSGLTVALPAVLLSSVGSERLNPTEGTCERDDIGYPVHVAIIAADNQDVTANHDTYLEWRRRIIKAFRNQQITISGSTNTVCQVEPGQITMAEHWRNNLWASELTIRVTMRETRGTGA